MVDSGSKNAKLKRKIQLETTDEQWNKVKTFAIANGYSGDLNSAVVELIDRGLKA